MLNASTESQALKEAPSIEDPMYSVPVRHKKFKRRTSAELFAPIGDGFGEVVDEHSEMPF